MEKIAGAIWAIYYHMICGPDSWCKYKKDKINRTDTYSRNKCLPSIFCEELEHISSRLSSSELLESCSKGLTQNQNESLNNVVWSKCSKQVFIGFSRFKLAVCKAIITFNDGAEGRQNLLESLNLDCANASKNVLAIQNKVRLDNAWIKVSEKYRKQCQKLRRFRKGKKNVACYIPGGFSTKLVPDNNMCTQSDIDFTKNDEVELKFVDGNNIPYLFYLQLLTMMISYYSICY